MFFFAVVKGQKELAKKSKKIKLFFKKVLTNGKSFDIIDKPTSEGNFPGGTCSLKIEQQRKFLAHVSAKESR